jgi:hypothetical protein
MWGRADVAASEAAALEGSEGGSGNHLILVTVATYSVYCMALITYLQHVSAQVYHLQGARYASFKSQFLFELAYCVLPEDDTLVLKHAADTL